MKKTRAAKQSPAQVLAGRINSTLGTDVVGLASDPRFTVQRVPTGSLTIDRITGGGLPRGRHVELFGDYQAGKSYVAYLTMALAQARGEICAIVDSEKVFDEEWFRFLGGDPDQLIAHRPKTAEQLIKVLMLMVEPDDEDPDRPIADIVTIDSVASLLPKEEYEKDVDEGDDRTAGRARMMSRALRRVTTVNDHTLFVWTNQLIDSVGGYGGPTTPGGRALKFYSSIRVRMTKAERKKLPRKRVKQNKLVTSDMPVGQWVTVRTEKNKTTRPEMESMFLFDFETKAIDHDMEIITLGLEDGLIKLSGKTYSFDDSDGNEWSGMETKFRKMIHDNPEMREELEWAIQENTRVIGLQREDTNGAED
jgi:recombination protein RecA